MKIIPILLSCVVLLLSAAAVPMSVTPLRDADPEFDLTGSLDVPIWSKGDFWNYTVDTSYDLGLVQIPLLGWINMSVEEVVPASFLEFDPTYLMNLTGNITGKFDFVISVRIYVDIEGYMLTRMQDLSNYIMVANVTVDGTESDLNGFYPFGYEYSPPLEEYDFPLIPGDEWTTHVTAGIPFSSEEGVDLDLESECGDLISVSVPAGSFDVLPIFVNGGPSLWYNGSVGNCVKRQFLIETSGLEVDLPLELDTYGHGSDPLDYSIKVSSQQPIWAGSEFQVSGSFSSASGVMSAILYLPGGKLAATKLVTSSELEFDIIMEAPMEMDNTPTEIDHGSFGILMAVYEGVALMGYNICTVTTRSTDLVVNETLVDLEYERYGTIDDHFTAHIGVRNPSNFGTGNFSVAVRVIDDDANNITYGPYMLEANATLLLDFPFTIDTAGNYTLEVYADSADEVIEYNESNNLYKLDFEVRERLELMIHENPDRGEYLISEGESLSFNVSTTRGNESIPPGKWSVDGMNLSSSYVYDFMTDYTGEGSSRMDPYVLAYTLPPNSTYENETDSVSWRIFVIDVNRAPEISDPVPLNSTVSILEGHFITFSADIYDPDDDDLEMVWTMDGMVIGYETSYNFTSNYAGNNSSDGSPYDISLKVTDNGTDPLTLYHNWTLTVMDVDRMFEYSLSHPEGDIEVDINDTLSISFSAEDPDGGQVLDQWEYLDVLINRSGGITISPMDMGLEPADTFPVYLKLTSGNFSAAVSWRIIVTGSIINDTQEPDPEDIPPIGVVILSPDKDTSFQFGSEIILRASHSDTRNITFKWSVGDQILYGSEVVLTGLESGNYTIILNASSNSDIGGSVELVTFFSVMEENRPADDNNDPLYMYILAAIGAMALLLLLIVVIYLIVKGRGDESEE